MAKVISLRNLLTAEETAKICKIKPSTLAQLRRKGKGPFYQKSGGRVMYDRREVKEYLSIKKFWSEMKLDQEKQ